MSKPFEFDRYTSISCRDGKTPIVPLAPIAGKYNGVTPNDGQYVPGEVIRRLFDYENAQEDGRMVISKLGIGSSVYRPCFSVADEDIVVAEYVIDAMTIRRHGLCENTEYSAKVRNPDSFLEHRERIAFNDSDIQHSVFANIEDAAVFASQVRRIIMPIAKGQAEMIKALMETGAFALKLSNEASAALKAKET